MTRFYLRPYALEKWLYQNKAEYVGDFVEGVLLDNFVVSTRRGYASIYEHYVNSNMSDYYVEFEKGTAQNMWNRWYQFEERSAQDAE